MDSERLIELRRRTFDTPQFRGIEFIEVEAKSIINHVPGGGLPFEWTINPYRGCTHACAYCTSPDTPVLMATGRTKPIADLRVGDEVYGTTWDGKYRRFVTSPVLAHWSTIKPAFRVVLEDGTQLVASGDHRFLSDRGWKHVTGAEQGAGRRPHLTVNNKLLGTGRFAEPPKQDDAYRRGYLCGMIRGDGYRGDYAYARASGREERMRTFRALVDPEALQRTREYLVQFDVPTRERTFANRTATRKPVFAIGCYGAGRLDRIESLVAWPQDPSASWRKGFLSGIFDAEGSYSRGILRICNGASVIVEWIASCFEHLDFRAVIEPPRPNGVRSVRLLGGVREALRFFLTVDPVITRKRLIEGQAIKNNAPLRVKSIEPLGIEMPMYDITTGTGDFIANGVVSHNCFARVTHTYLDMNAGRDFESKILVKVNAPDLLRTKLRSKSWKGHPIAMGTATDPYQRAEGRYKLMPGIIGALTDYRNPFSILTKGTLMLRDLGLLVEAAQTTDVSTAYSIGTLDTEAWRRSEPGTPHPRKRMDAVKAINAAGIPCGVLVAPVLPGISDGREQLRDVVRAAVDAGAAYVSPILLHLRPVVREEYMAWLQDEYPELVQRYEDLYPRAYAPASERRRLETTIGRLLEEEGGRPGATGGSDVSTGSLHRGPSRNEPPRELEQLSLLDPPRRAPVSRRRPSSTRENPGPGG